MFIEIIAGGDSWEVVYRRGAETTTTTTTTTGASRTPERVIIAPRGKQPRQKSANGSVIVACRSRPRRRINHRRCNWIRLQSGKRPAAPSSRSLIAPCRRTSLSIERDIDVARLTRRGSMPDGFAVVASEFLLRRGNESTIMA